MGQHSFGVCPTKVRPERVLSRFLDFPYAKNGTPETAYLRMPSSLISTPMPGLLDTVMKPLSIRGPSWVLYRHVKSFLAYYHESRNQLLVFCWQMLANVRSCCHIAELLTKDPMNRDPTTRRETNFSSYANPSRFFSKFQSVQSIASSSRDRFLSAASCFRC